MSVKVSTRQVGDVTVADVAGKLTLGEASGIFREALRNLIAQGHKKILLNLNAVSYMDSSGIGELVAAYTTVTSAGGKAEAGESDPARSESSAKHQAVYRV